MRKLITILSILFVFNANSQISYFVQQAGKYMAFGLSTDTKPSSPPNNCYFVEINTNKTFVSTGGSWSLVGIGVDSIAVRLQLKTDSLAAALLAFNQATYFSIASAAGKITGGSASLASNFTTSSITAVNTNLTFAIASGEIYDVTITGTCSKATTATGLKFAISTPAGCTIKGFQLGGGATLAALPVPSLITAINTLGATLATGIGIEVTFQLHFRVVNSTNAGNIRLQAATVTSNVATIFAGTKMTWIKSVTL